MKKKARPGTLRAYPRSLCVDDQNVKPCSIHFRISLSRESSEDGECHVFLGHSFRRWHPCVFRMTARVFRSLTLRFSVSSEFTILTSHRPLRGEKPHRINSPILTPVLLPPPRYRNQMTVADIVMVVRIKSLKDGVLDGIPATIADPYPSLMALYESVTSEPKISNFILKHKK